MTELQCKNNFILFLGSCCSDFVTQPTNQGMILIRNSFSFFPFFFFILFAPVIFRDYSCQGLPNNTNTYLLSNKRAVFLKGDPVTVIRYLSDTDSGVGYKTCFERGSSNVNFDSFGIFIICMCIRKCGQRACTVSSIKFEK